ncbi:cytochrome C oxidase subunit II [Sinimarinibacterium sp. NLF-5-8]|uniref:cytochrome C oxidase subunit II n=1 Tax=Sinimarinibacterium sp. NLF-5-8 TaxID=2698684 RepID=UPI00137BBC61|nr:cytochrome C oxidase subunit II [Sinimarinibacterium sp. NLF-5-8]QHS11216.1 cytochrome C oxidase subunit II [Sinimarinibacterium sp. NLF-5-8]
MQDLVWMTTLALMGLIGVIFLTISAGASRGGGDVATMTTTAYAWRTRLFWAVLLFGIGLSFATLWKWPIAGHANPSPTPDRIIKATGHQWYWTLDQNTVKAGELVEFQLHTEDVSHGFGVYRNSTHLIGQTQAMPGYVNKLQLRFDEPGEYQVLCMEYCGIGHHIMRATIHVSE